MRKLAKKIVVALLTWEARMALRRHKPFIIAVTGSVGKTSTKDAIATILREDGEIRASQKSFNSEIGVPLTILGLSNAWQDTYAWMKNIYEGFRTAFFTSHFPKTLVLEVGADHPGDIKNITKWLKPDIAVVTRLPDLPVHVEYFSSPEEVKKEKAELVRALRPGGIFIANADDPAVVALSSLTRARMLTYGFGETAQVKGSTPEVVYKNIDGRNVAAGMKFHLDWQGNSFPVILYGVLGISACMSALAGIAVGIARNMNVLDVVNAMQKLESPKGRMRIISGVSGSTIIDDTYNSSPVALEAALETLRKVDANHRIAVLGDMLELGEHSELEHWKLGRVAGGFVDQLLSVGPRAAGIAEGAKTAGLPEGKIHTFANSKVAGLWLASQLKTGDIVLVKGSQGSGENMIRMERAVKELMAHPEDSYTQLVRQEREWQLQYKD